MADRLRSQIRSRGSQPQQRSGGNVPQPSRLQNAGPSTGSRPQQGTSAGGTTYTGVGEPMQIDRQRQKKKFHCYNCGKFGHISRDCNKPRITKTTNQVRSMEVDAQPSNETPRSAPRKGKKKKQFVRAFLQDLGSDEKEFLVEELVKDMGNQVLPLTQLAKESRV